MTKIDKVSDCLLLGWGSFSISFLGTRSFLCFCFLFSCTNLELRSVSVPWLAVEIWGSLNSVALNSSLATPPPCPLSPLTFHKILLCRPGWPWIYFFLPQLLECWGCRGLSQACLLLLFFLPLELLSSQAGTGRKRQSPLCFRAS